MIKIIETHIKKILNEILLKYNDIISKEMHDIRNCKQVKHDIKLIDKRFIKYK